ncbi:MAG: DNA translocase FtsK, partial [Clostridia bacterium]|nr:DNA translocase FtsK [Clostridia bacterium]
DPKKAAGSLQWAVNEMERRFGLIESVGVRDIDGFNKITENDPEMEHMSRIIIVIDELADLMSTAPDDVETSIARLAAKARAAGMHLVIGTQRPSVDVITGVIKANIPSRIACTVASQVDSRTIIDRSGAENLIGRGDMLYSPVGAAKPLRVQGAFVSDSEVDAVVSFIKANNCQGGADYSDEVMKEIEAQAALCGVKKSGSAAAAQAAADGGEGGDPLIDQALEVAFENGKISTSLLQRRLSVGYGRAAKIIDKMEELGYVSAPDGQKLRQLLITKQDYMEMKLKKEDDE